MTRFIISTICFTALGLCLSSLVANAKKAQFKDDLEVFEKSTYPEYTRASKEYTRAIFLYNSEREDRVKSLKDAPFQRIEPFKHEMPEGPPPEKPDRPYLSSESLKNMHIQYVVVGFIAGAVLGVLSNVFSSKNVTVPSAI